MSFVSVGTCFVAALILAASPSQGRAPITGIYTDMASTDGEHIDGTEIFVVKGGGKYYVMIQTAEGTSSIPLVVPASVQGDSLTFDLQGTLQKSPGQFHGRIGGGNLVG